jgi:hypothetical protein
MEDVNNREKRIQLYKKYYSRQMKNKEKFSSPFNNPAFMQKIKQYVILPEEERKHKGRISRYKSHTVDDYMPEIYFLHEILQNISED